MSTSSFLNGFSTSSLEKKTPPPTSFSFKHKKTNNTSLPLNIIVQVEGSDKLASSHLVSSNFPAVQTSPLSPQRKREPVDVSEKIIAQRFNAAFCKRKDYKIDGSEQSGDISNAQRISKNSLSPRDSKEVCDIDQSSAIDYSRFIIKEGGRKTPSQSILLFEQLRKKANINYMTSLMSNNSKGNPCSLNHTQNLVSTSISNQQTTPFSMPSASKLSAHQVYFQTNTDRGSLNFSSHNIDPAQPLYESMSPQSLFIRDSLTFSQSTHIMANGKSSKENVIKSASNNQLDQSVSSSQIFHHNYQNFLLKGERKSNFLSNPPVNQDLQYSTSLKGSGNILIDENGNQNLSKNMDSFNSKDIANKNSTSIDKEGSNLSASQAKEKRFSFINSFLQSKNQSSNSQQQIDSTQKNSLFKSFRYSSTGQKDNPPIQLLQDKGLFQLSAKKYNQKMVLPQIKYGLHSQDINEKPQEQEGPHKILKQIGIFNNEGITHNQKQNGNQSQNVRNNMQMNLNRTKDSNNQKSTQINLSEYIKQGVVENKLKSPSSLGNNYRNSRSDKYEIRNKIKMNEEQQSHQIFEFINNNRGVSRGSLNINGQSSSNSLSIQSNQKNIMKQTFNHKQIDSSTYDESPLEQILSDHTFAKSQENFNHSNGRKSATGYSQPKLNFKSSNKLSFCFQNEISSPPFSCFQSQQQIPSKLLFGKEESHVQPKQEINSNVHNIIIQCFQSRNFKKHAEELNNIQFKSTFFDDLIEKIVAQINTSGTQNKNQQHKFSFIKEQLKTLGITPQKTQFMVDEIALCLQENQVQDFEHISKQFAFYFENHLNWTLLDYFGMESDLRILANDLLELLQADMMCQKILSMYSIDSSNIYNIIYIAFSQENIDPHQYTEVLLKGKQFEEGNSVTQKYESSRSLNLTYADFFYVKYRLTYFFQQRKISLKIIFAILERIEKFRPIVLKKPYILDFDCIQIFSNSIRRSLIQKTKLVEALSRKGFHIFKIECALINLAKHVIERSSSFFPSCKLPLNLGEVFNQFPEVLNIFSEELGQILERFDKYVQLDAKLIISTIEVSVGIKQSFNDSIQSPKTLDELFQKLLFSFEENQTFKMFTQLSDQLNIQIFAFNLLCYLFNIFSSNQPCLIFTLDIQAQFKMFGCNFVAFNDFLIQVEKVFESHLSPGYFDGFIQNACKGLKGLDIFD